MFPISITITERNPADLSARAHREISRACFERIGQVWQGEILPPRFTTSSPNYPHKPRTRRYLAQKQKDADKGKVLFGGQVLNVRTGNMKEILTRLGIVRAFPTRATVSKEGPKYITMRPYQSNQPDKWAELTWLSREEKQRLNREAGATYDRLRAQVNETRHFSTG